MANTHDRQNMRVVKAPEILSTYIVSALVFLLIFTPIAFGTTQPWSIFLFQIIVASMVFCWAVRTIFEQAISVTKTIVYIPIILSIFLAAVQLLPLPASFIKAAAPNTFEIKSFAFNFLQIPGNFYSLSLNDNATFQWLIQYVCIAAVFFISLNELNTPGKINLVFGILLVAGFVIAFFAIIQNFTWSGKIFWVHDIHERYGVFGPFVNYDHYGGYINMVIMIGFGFLFSGIEASKKILVGFFIGIMGASLLLSTSRGAVLSFAVGVFYLGMLFFMSRKNNDRKTFFFELGTIFFILALIGIFIYWIDWSVMTGRLSTVFKLEHNFFNPRYDIWRDSLGLVRRFAVFGSGLNTYALVFPLVQATHTGFFWRHAHNDYLELLIEAGPLALALALSFVVIYFSKVLRKIRAGENRSLAGLLAGGSAGVVTMLMHTFVDFNLHIAANAYLFTLITGATLSMTMISKSGDPGYNYFFKLRSSASKIVPVLAIGAIFLFFLSMAYRQYTGYKYFERAGFTAASAPLRSRTIPASIRIDDLHKALVHDTGNPIYHYQLALAYQEEASAAGINGVEQKKLLTAGKMELETALRASPAEAKYWSSYGWLLGNLGDAGKAEMAFRRAIELSPDLPGPKYLYDEFIKRHEIKN
jgi:O-antigen ligase